jgi:Tol biopolymer transport system component
VTRPFGTPVLVGGVNQSGSASANARFTPDELTIFFISDRGGTPNVADVYTATRTSRTSAFGTPQPLAAVNSSMHENCPSVTSDMLTFFLESNRAGQFGVFVASRSNTFTQFSTPSLVTAVNSGSNDGQPQVLPDGSALYYVSFRSGVGGGDIYRAPILAGGQVGAPTIVPRINSSVNDYAPAPSADELVLYFNSDRSDATAKGGYDIWMAKRASRTADFDPPVNVQELNTSADEGVGWISPDKCRLYLHRGGMIYAVERAP